MIVSNVFHENRLYATFYTKSTIDKTTFLTPASAAQQVGFIKYGAGQSISRHKHLDTIRTIVGTTEVIVVKSGSCRLHIYDDATTLESRLLCAGDLAIIYTGGHSYDFLEETVLIEIKQGPYVGPDEKVVY